MSAAPDAPDPAHLVSRRRVLHWAGGAGLATVVGGCAVEEPGTRAEVGPPRTPVSGEHRVPDTAQAPRAPIVTATPHTTLGVVLCRDAWGARPARPGGAPHTLTRMTIHHTGVVLGDNRSAPARLRQHQRYHQDQQGWIDIAYHLSVDRNGDIYELRRPEWAGDTATGYDTTGHFLVVCEGDFDTEQVSDAQLNGAAMAFAWAAQTFQISSSTLASHRDVSPNTECPGASLYARLTSGGLRRRIDDLLAGGVVKLQQICGPEAASVVAAIEAGQ